MTDPDKQGNILIHFREMGALLAETTAAVPEAPPSQVRSPANALAEAMYFLCCPSANEDETAPLSPIGATDLLSRLKLDLHRMDDLKDAVMLLAAGIFSGGTGKLSKST